MALRARIHCTAAVYRVMQRGNGGQDIFFDESHRHRFYGLLEEGGNRLRKRAETPPVWRQILRGQEKTWHKCKDVNPDPLCFTR